MMLAEGESSHFSRHVYVKHSCSASRPEPSPQETGKAAALPVVKHRDFVQGLNIYWVATAIGVMRPLAGLVE